MITADELRALLVFKLTNNEPALTNLDFYGQSLKCDDPTFSNNIFPLKNIWVRKHKVKEVTEIFQALRFNRTVTALNLRHCHLGGANGEMVKELCEVLKQNRHITSLNLAANQLFRYGKSVSFLAEALAVNQSLTMLDLSSNGITDEDIKTLKPALQVHPELRKIKLGFNNLTRVGHALLLELLRYKHDLILENFEQVSGRPPTEKFKLNLLSASDEESGNQPVLKRQKAVSFFDDHSRVIASSSVSVKTEPQNRRHPLAIEDIRRAAIRIRGQNDAKQNCARLQACMVKYLMTGTIQVAEESRPSSKEAPCHNEKVEVKHEPNASPLLQKVYTGVDRAGIFSYLSPARVPAVEVLGEKNVFNLDQSEIDIEDSRFQLDKCYFTNFKEVILGRAAQEGGVVLGIITLGRCGYKFDTIPAGHGITFYAINTTDQQKVIFIDPQLFNGLTATGEPLFSELTSAYRFQSQMKAGGNVEHVFGNVITYQVISAIKINPEISHEVSRP